MIVGGGLAGLTSATVRGDATLDIKNFAAGLGGAVVGAFLGPRLIGSPLGRGDIAAAISNLAFMGASAGALGLVSANMLGGIPKK